LTQALLVSMSLLVACHGVSWPSGRIVRSLRVLAVQAEPASVTPGQSSQLSLLLADGIDSPDNGIDNPDAGANADIDVAWFGACDNPPHNDPSKCLSQYAGWLDQISPVLADHSLSSTSAPFQVARTFQYHAPDSVLQNQVTVGGQTIHYGNSYVYFAVCAGKLSPAAGLTDQLPVQCRDRSSNALLDQSRFVVGVTTLYAYDKILNHNPVFPVPRKCLGLSMAQCAAQSPQFASAVPYAGKACSVDSECNSVLAGSAVSAVGGVSPASACASDGVCAPRVSPCTKNVPGSCGVHDIGIEVADSSFVLTGLDGTLIPNPLKSLWVDCYSNTGAWPDDPHHGISGPPVNEFTDPNLSAYLDVLTTMTGCGNGWQAPTQPTDQARVWAVVRDDRGGLAWLEKRFVVRLAH
jgi:hypothetical protein